MSPYVKRMINENRCEQALGYRTIQKEERSLAVIAVAAGALLALLMYLIREAL